MPARRCLKQRPGKSPPTKNWVVPRCTRKSPAPPNTWRKTTPTACVLYTTTIYDIGDGFVIEMASVDAEAQHLHTIYHDLENVLGRTADWFDIFAAYDRLVVATTSNVAKQREPDAPIGWPSAQAPPWMLTLLCGISRSCMAAIGTTVATLLTIPMAVLAGRNITMTLSPLPANRRKRRFAPMAETVSPNGQDAPEE